MWASALVPGSCDSCESTEAGFACDVNCKWERQAAAWRYAWNNLRLAVEAADPAHRAKLSDDMHRQLAELHVFIGQLGNGMHTWIQNWHLASTAVREILAYLQPWLSKEAYRPGPALLVPLYNHGLRFPGPGRSVQVPTNGDLGARVSLSNGVAMPILGFGVSGLPPEDEVAYRAVRQALQMGYRHVDTAQSYGNEIEVGRAIRDSGLSRQEIFLVTKLSDIEKSKTRQTFESQLSKLGVEYVDVYMLHHAGSDRETRTEVWQELEALYDEGHIRALGVSNFGIELLEELFSFARVKPVYVQNKFTIYQPGGINEAMEQVSVMEWLGSHGVLMTGFSVINPSHWSSSYLEPLRDPHVLAIASRVKRSASQVLHRWVLQLGAAVIPKSSSYERIMENAQVFDFALDEAEMRLLNGLASLAASTPIERRPPWCEDVYGLERLSTG